MVSGDERRGLLVEPLLSVDLPLEVAGMLFAGVVAVAGPPELDRKSVV